MLNYFRIGRASAWVLALAVPVGIAGTVRTLAATMSARYERDVSRMVFNDNQELLADIWRQVVTHDSLDALLVAQADTAVDRGVIVVSIADRRLTYRVGQQVVFETRVATGSGRILVQSARGARWKFETPRGRLVVQSKDVEPQWVPPDWHYLEVARTEGLEVARLLRGQTLRAGDGSEITISGNDVVRRHPGGRDEVLAPGGGREIVVAGTLVIPPFGTNQRRYPGVLGPFRLNLGDGYALHGTNVPSSIGQAVSHGCIRLRNEDIETLYRMVPVGTPVYVY